MSAKTAILAVLKKFHIRTGTGDHAARVVELEMLLERPADKVLIVLSGPGDTPPPAVLSYIDAIRSARAQVAVLAMGPLVGADFALWLAAGPVRDIAPNASVYVYNPFPCEPRTVEELVLLDSYARCLALMKEHTDLASVLGKGLGAEDLRDMWLLDCSPLDAAADELPPDSPGERGHGKDNQVSL